jgi:hypothetical protein
MHKRKLTEHQELLRTMTPLPPQPSSLEQSELTHADLQRIKNKLKAMRRRHRK